LSRHLLVIGAQRSGSTYLTSLLDAHPEIAMARPARPEPKVFLSDEILARGPDWYRDTYFAHVTTERLLGEKSTSYIEDGSAPARAAKVLGEAEIVAVLRDPIARAVSNWQFSTANGFETRPVEQALTENLHESRAWEAGATSVSPFAYLERGRYVSYLEPWDAVFGERVHVVLLPELLGSSAVLHDLYSSLGVDPDFHPEATGTPVNRSAEPAPGLSDELVGKLRDYFKDSDQALAGRLQRNLSWSGEAGSDPA
jgi:hypothetical protein